MNIVEEKIELIKQLFAQVDWEDVEIRIGTNTDYYPDGHIVKSYDCQVVYVDDEDFHDIPVWFVKDENTIKYDNCDAIEAVAVGDDETLMSALNNLYCLCEIALQNKYHVEAYD